MLPLSLLLSSFVFAVANAQSSTASPASSSLASSSPSSGSSNTVILSSTASGATSLLISTLSSASATIPTGSYESITTTVTLVNTNSSTMTSTASEDTAPSNSTMTSTSSTSKDSLTAVAGTATATSTSATPINTTPCNNYAEFCDRKYSNITEVCAHNSAFVKADSAFANQQYEIVAQLNDGIRMIQGEVHYVNDTLYSCHSSCDYLNAGLYVDELTTVVEWLDANPYDVVTVLIVNSDYVDVGNFTIPIEDSGLIDYVYYPSVVPMALNDWPTLSELILSGKRAVVFMDYEANQTAVPYILDEFSQMSETPFSPTDPSFPCTAQRPPGITTEEFLDRLYIANHNLNVEIDIDGLDLLIPNFADLVEVNAASGYSSLGLMSNNCRSDWAGRPPNFLLVDFYNDGNGSVFEVAAQMNNVTYTGKCCGSDDSISTSDAVGLFAPLPLAAMGVVAVLFMMV